jgi:hypothetical protein
MTTNIVTALKSVVTSFSKDGIAKVKGENVVLAAKQLTAVVKVLLRLMLCWMRLLEISWMGHKRVLSLSLLRYSSWKVLCTVQPNFHYLHWR